MSPNIGRNIGYLVKRIDQIMQVNNIIDGERETKNIFKAHLTDPNYPLNAPLIHSPFSLISQNSSEACTVFIFR